MMFISSLPSTTARRRLRFSRFFQISETLLQPLIILNRP
ncbi:unnamed protein product [Brassica rapa subsp. trilocularis]